MNYKKLIKGLLLSIAISSTYGDACDGINAYANTNNVNLSCGPGRQLVVKVKYFSKDEAKKDFLQKFLEQFPEVNILEAEQKELEGRLIIPENSKLETLKVSDNKLSGEMVIPINSTLKYLSIENNNLTGNLTIPLNVEELYASNNQFTGDVIIPENSELNTLYAYKNKFDGNLIFQNNCTTTKKCKVSEIDVSHNNLKGEVIIPGNSTIFEIKTNVNDDMRLICDDTVYEAYSDYCIQLVGERRRETRELRLNIRLACYLALIIVLIIIILVLRNLDKKNEKRKKNPSSFESGKCYTAGSNYVPTRVNELAISVDNRIKIIEVLDSVRANGKNINTSQSGEFPLSCLIEDNNQKKLNYKNALKALYVTLGFIIIMFLGTLFLSKVLGFSY